ncbi:MAG: glycosyl transferase [Terriglobia bacterium]|nr:MAG: glycosyl transferase [Terriglobia bacterium]
MGSVLEELPRGARVLVIRLRSLGDCVLTTPALEILKGFRPDLQVAILVEDRFRDLFAGNPDIDDILSPEFSSVRAARPHLCLNFHGGTRSAWMTAASGARYRAGFGHFRGQLLYNVRIPRAQEILGVSRKVHTAEHLASAMFYLGAPRAEIPRAKLAARRDANAAAVIHAFATGVGKSWRAEGFLEVASHLRDSGHDVVFLAGASDDLSPFRDFRALRAAPLGEVKSLLAAASLFVGNDSGPAHMAAAFGVPSVVIFGSSDPAIWGPWRTPAEVIAEPGGIAQVGVDQVLEALARLRVHA